MTRIYRKFGLAVFGFYGYQINQITNSSTVENIFVNNNSISQNAINSRQAPLGDGSIDVSYEFDSLHLLAASANRFQSTTYNGRNQSSVTDSAGFLQQSYNLINTNSEKYLGFDAGINYQLGFEKSKDALLTFSYQFGYAPDEKASINNFSNRKNYGETVFPDFQQYDSEGITTHTAQIDYAGPLSKKLSIEAGTKAIFRSDYSNFHENDLDSTSNEYQLNESQTNNFSYHQDVFSLYNSYQLKLDKWSCKGGLRLEHTSVNADFTSTGVAISSNYNNLIPSISIQGNFAKSSVNFGYAQRIQRPGIAQLSPYIYRIDPLFINTGNPSLRPELDNTFELTYNRFGKNTVIVGATYALSTNSIQRVTSLQLDSIDGSKDTVNYTTYQNLGVNRTLGINVNLRFNFSNAFSLGINSRVSHIWLKGDYNGYLYSNQGYFGNAFMNARYKLNHGYSVSINEAYISGNITLQGHSEGRFLSQYLLTKNLLKNKATITLAAANPWGKYLNLRTVSAGPDYSQVSYNQAYYRSLFVRISYKFGKLSSEIKKNQRGIHNDDLKQSE
jgi:outer membrane receptor protein involved in Fe transport